MKVLILGGAGFIGSHTALRLQELGHEPIVADSFDPQIHGSDLAASGTLRPLWGRVPVVCGDTRDRAFLERALGEVEAVYYFPAGTGTGQSMYQVERYTDINVRGAAVFAEVLTARKDRIRKVIVSSSRAVYGEGVGLCPEHGRVYPKTRRSADLEKGVFDSLCPICGSPLELAASLESDATGPVSIYGITKLAQEQIIANVCEATGIPAAIFRYQNVYGPGQSLSNPYTGILSIFTQLLLADREINLFEDSRPVRDFVFVGDVVEYNCRALEAELPAGPTVLNVGSGVPSTLVQLVEALGVALQRTPRFFVSGQFRLGDIRNAVADTSRLQAVLGRHDFVGLQAGVSAFVDWVQATGVSAGANERFDRSLAEMRAAGLLKGGQS